MNNMTRLEQQMEDMLVEYNIYTSFARTKFAKTRYERFLHDLEQYIVPSLSKYGKRLVNPTSNSFVDKSIVDSKTLYYRVYIDFDGGDLSDRRIENLKNLLMSKINKKDLTVLVNKSKITLVYP